MAWIDLTLLFARRPLGMGRRTQLYELLHGNKTEINIIYINNKNYHTNIFPAFYIPFKTGYSNCFAPSCFCSLKTRYVTVLTPTKPSCIHRFFNVGLLPEPLWSCSFGF